MGDDGLQEEVTSDDVIGALHEITDKRASGLDGIHGRTLKVASEQLAPALANLCNDCLSIGYFPEDWKIGKLVTILKAPDRDPGDPRSIRPLTLLPELGKMFERILIKKLHNFVPDLHHERQMALSKVETPLKQWLP